MVDRIRFYLRVTMFAEVVKISMKHNHDCHVDDYLYAAIKKIDPTELINIIQAYQPFMEKKGNVFSPLDDEYYPYGCYSLEERNVMAENAKVLIGAIMTEIHNKKMNEIYEEFGLDTEENDEMEGDECPVCGSILEEDGYCSKCKRFRKESEVELCGRCGAKLTFKNFCSHCLQEVFVEDEVDSGKCPVCRTQLCEDGWCPECLEFTTVKKNAGKNNLKIEDNILIDCDAEFEERDWDDEGYCSYSSMGLDRDGDPNGEEVPYVNIPKGVIEIKDKVFKDCFSIEAIKIPDSVKKIGEYAFENSSIKHIRIPDGVKVIERYTFSESSLESIYIPDSVEEIKHGAFSSCRHLKQVRLPKKLKILDEYAFAHCESLEVIIIPEGVEKIYPKTFFGCDNLKSVKFPKTLKYIGSEAFSCCRNMETVEIPEGIISIARDAFSGYISKPNIYKYGKYLGNKENPYLVLWQMATEDEYGDPVWIDEFEVHKDTKIILEPFTLSYCNRRREMKIILPDGLKLLGDYQFHEPSSYDDEPPTIFYNVYNKGRYLGSRKNPYMVLTSIEGYKPKSFELHPDTKFLLIDFDYQSRDFGSLSNDFKFNIYKNGKYVGTNKNPYYALVGRVNRNEEYEVHKDTVINYIDYEKIKNGGF